jgi:hypothetical protein
MKTEELENSATDPEALSDEEAILASFVSGTPVDPDVQRRVHERAQKIRQEIFRKHGLVDIAVPAIRELRGELPDA